MRKSGMLMLAVASGVWSLLTNASVASVLGQVLGIDILSNCKGKFACCGGSVSIFEAWVLFF